jgi:hypothetical protein
MSKPFSIRPDRMRMTTLCAVALQLSIALPTAAAYMIADRCGPPLKQM